MSIKSQLKLIIPFIVFLSLLFSVSIYNSLQDYKKALLKTEVAGNIVQQVFERKVLADEYLTTNTERAKTQWFSKQNDIKKTIAAHQDEFNSLQEKELLTRINDGVSGGEAVFVQTVSLIESKQATSGAVLVSEKRERLSSQLSVYAQEVISAAASLSDINDIHLANALQQIILLFSVVASLFFLILLISFGIIWRSASKLDQEKAKDDAILSSVGDGLVAIDLQGKVTLLNAAVEKLIGWSQVELLGKNWVQNVPIEDDKGNSVPLEQRPFGLALKEGKTIVSNQFSYVKKDSQKIPVSITVSPIISEGKNLGVIEVFRDITHEREVDRMKSEFISLASHQLRTPLSAMKWFLEMLLTGDAGPLSPDQKEMVKNVDESNERMIGLVNSLLNVSRIESGRIIVDPVPTDLGQLIREVEVDLKAKIEEKQQQFTVTVVPNLPKVNIDPKLIRQVYMNLLTNAIKYTPKAGAVSVSVSQKDDQIISQVTDNGYGIPASDHNKVFQKFYRGENIVKLETDGNGLGMYLVKTIIESSKGKIWFESTEGKGTTFWFTIPLSGMEAKKGEVTLGS